MSAERAVAPGSLRAIEDRAQRLQRRAEREHAARHEAERLLESKSLELFAANQRLLQLNGELERRVQARTQQAEDARRSAIKIGSTDHLTGIWNRLHYSQELACSLARTVHDGGATGLLLVDLDGFKRVNDTYGHSYGDQLLVTIADRLRVLTRGHDVVARIGGDEFAIILKRDSAAAICRAARRFRSVFGDPITICGVTIQCSGSIGLAISPDHSDNASDLQRFADLALYQSKERGDGEMVVFEPSFRDAYEHRQRLEAEFRRAVNGGGIDLVYQPIIHLQSGAVEAVEALARWSDSNGASVSPAYFIPMAEQCGIIRGVGRSLLEKTLIETKGWIDARRIDRVSFNVSPLELLDENFSAAILDTLGRVGVEPSNLLLEITEGAVMQNMALAGRVIDSLASHGVMFALDDFGCGYSDLSALRTLAISVLKIDRSLLVDCDRDRAARVILRSVVALCRELGIRSVCEGAETQSQIDFLRSIQCDLVQGFALGLPMSTGDLAGVLAPAEGGPGLTGNLPRGRFRGALANTFSGPGGACA